LKPLTTEVARHLLIPVAYAPVIIARGQNVWNEARVMQWHVAVCCGSQARFAMLVLVPTSYTGLVQIVNIWTCPSFNYHEQSSRKSQHMPANPGGKHQDLPPRHLARMI